MQALLKGYGVDVEIELRSDASAAIGMVQRQGLGRVRHLATSDLWIQQRCKRGDLKVEKWPGKDNPSDALTKGVEHPVISMLFRKIGAQVWGGRPATAPARKDETFRG